MSVWATDENDSPSKHNQKLRIIANATQLSNIATTTEGQLIFSTSNSATFPVDKLRARLTGNSAWSAIFTESSEYSTSYPAYTGDQNINAGKATLQQFTLPTTEKFYIITGFEWFNGATLGSNMICGAFVSNSATPASALSKSPMVAFSQETAQAGTNAIQRVSNLRTKPIKAGSILYFFMQASNVTGNFKYKNSGTGIDSTVTYSATPKTVFNMTLNTGVELDYLLKLYYTGYS